jgi:arsenate reductase (glutaredoxin)
VTVTLYGIKNCDTMKKARAWLDAHGINYRFHDYRTDGVPSGALERWVEDLGWETLLNRSGTTFRKLPDADRVHIDETRAIALMQAQPSMIKRPIMTRDDGAPVAGFSPERYSALFR